MDEWNSRGESVFNKLQWQDVPFSQVIGKVSDALGGPIESGQSSPAQEALKALSGEVVDQERAWM